MTCLTWCESRHLVWFSKTDNVLLLDLVKVGRVVEAQDGEQGRDLLTSGESFDLALIDLQMPIMDGLQCVRDVRAWEEREGDDEALPVPQPGTNAKSPSDRTATPILDPFSPSSSASSWLRPSSPNADAPTSSLESPRPWRPAACCVLLPEEELFFTWRASLRA